MSTDASAGATEDAVDDGPAEYDRILDDLDVAIGEARRKVESGRVYDPENEKVRIKWVRALAYAANVRRQIMADRDLEALTERVAELEQREDGGL